MIAPIHKAAQVPLWLSQQIYICDSIDINRWYYFLSQVKSANWYSLGFSVGHPAPDPLDSKFLCRTANTPIILSMPLITIIWLYCLTYRDITKELQGIFHERVYDIIRKEDLAGMANISIVGCTGKLGSSIIKAVYKQADIELKYAITRPGNKYVGQDISTIIGSPMRNIKITDSISAAADSDLFIECTNVESFIQNNLQQYFEIKKPIIIATTGFSTDELNLIKELAKMIPVLISGNFSIALHDFIETIKYAAIRINEDTDVRIIEYHHNQKKDAPSGTAKMIQEALIKVNPKLNQENVCIFSVRGGSIFGKHQVIFANNKDEVIEYIHQVSSREAFSYGAIEAAKWLINQSVGYYSMDDFCNSIL